MKAERFALSQELRSATSELHIELESLVDFNKLTQDRDHYFAILSAFLPVYCQLEYELTQVFAGTNVLNQFPQTRSARIVRDLRSVQIFAAANRTSCSSTISCPSAGFGVLYVLEGAAIGGQLISRAAVKNLGVTAGNGCEFFGSEGEDAGTRWRNLRLMLDLVAESEYEDAICAAKYVFMTLGKSIRYELTLNSSREHQRNF